jgi:hypothetical protein
MFGTTNFLVCFTRGLAPKAGDVSAFSVVDSRLRSSDFSEDLDSLPLSSFSGFSGFSAFSVLSTGVGEGSSEESDLSWPLLLPCCLFRVLVRGLALDDSLGVDGFFFLARDHD